MKDWQAAIAAYVILSLLAETEFAPVSVVLSWGIVVTEIISVGLQKPGIVSTLTSQFNNTVQTAPQGPATPAQAAAAQGNAGGITVPPNSTAVPGG